jgi:hypothetical protein
VPPPPSAANNANASANASSNASANSSSSPPVPIGASILAAIAGVGVVGAAAQAVEIATADTCLPYTGVASNNANAERFDQSTFSGRFARMLLACDPALLLHTEDTVRASLQSLVKAEEDLATAKMTPSPVVVSTSTTSTSTTSAATLTPSESRTLWEAKRIVDSAIHPDTGEVIPRPFRMSGYVPYNGPICVSMVAATSTIPLLFWSWVNQSQNALVNYYVSRCCCC